MTRPPIALRVASVVFSAALRVLPGRFRGAFGPDIRELFADDASAAYRRGGTWQLLRTTAAALADVASTDRRPMGAPGKGLLAGVVQDMRYALRTFLRQPGFTLAAVGMLALGIGGNTAIFSLVNGAMLRPLPYPDADRLVRVWGARVDLGETRNPINPNDAADWQRGSPAIESLGVASVSTQPLTGTGDPVMIPVTFVTSGIFEVLQVSPAKGRLLGPQHDAPGHETEVVITDGFWRRVLGGDPNVIGRTVRLSDVACTIIGVLGPGFVSPGVRAGAEPQIWRPLVVPPDNRGGHFTAGIARLKSGASLAQAQAQVDAVAERLSVQFPSTNLGQRARLEPLHQAIAGDTRSAMLILMAAVAVVLLIGCANVANLLLARATTRRREFAVRGALGATRARLVRQLLAESLLLASAAAGAGLAAGVVALNALPAWLADQLPTVLTATIDSRVVVFTILLSIGTVVLFGLVPAIVASRHDLRAPLAAGAPGGGGGTRGFQSGLVVTETALALILLVAATLLVQSLDKLQRVDPGFTTAQALTFRISLPRTRYAQPEQRNAFFQRVIERVGAEPGVVAAGGVNTSPLSGRNSCDSFGLADRPAPPDGQEPCAEVRVATPGYFAAMGIPVIAGRSLAASDVASTLPVAVISNSMARRYWPGANAIGQRLKWGSVASDRPWLTIVGVIGDVRHFGLDEVAPDEVYMPLNQSSAAAFTLALRTDGDPAGLREQVSAIVREADPALPIAELFTTRELVARSLALPAFRTGLLAVFAGLALMLAMAGVYSLIAFHVAQRRREIGIRLALGATPGEVKRLIVRRGVTAVAAGCVLGTIVSIPLMQLTRDALFAVTPEEPMAYAIASAVLLFTAFFASYLPARHATSFDAVESIRAE